MQPSIFSRALRYLFLATAVMLFSCATPARQTETLLASPREISEKKRLSSVPFIAQTENYCGPATLAMAMQYAGKVVKVDEVAAQVYTPGKKGSLQQDMISSARRQGMLALQIQGLPALLQEIDGGNPVIVFLNLGLSWYPIYHYAFVHGYDLAEPSIFLHSGKTKNKEWNMRKFERNWELGQYWGLVILPPSKLSVAASEMEHGMAGAGLEAIGKLPEAEMVYFNILQRWPESFGALVGMGNLTYAREDFASSVQYLLQAVRSYPSSHIAWHNLTLAQGAAGQRKAAGQSAKQALTLAPGPVKAKYGESLQKWLKGARAGAAPLPGRNR